MSHAINETPVLSNWASQGLFFNTSLLRTWKDLFSQDFFHKCQAALCR